MGMALPSLSFAEMLVQTQSNTWSTSITATIANSTASTAGAASSSQSIGTNVSHYTGVLDLSRVVIKVLQPQPTVSPNFTVNITSDTPTTFNTNADPLYNNRAYQSTTLSSSSAITQIQAYSGSTTNYASTQSSAPWTGSSSPVSTTLDITNGPVTIFDSALFPNNFVFDSTNLNAIFRDGDASFSFNFTATSGFGFSSAAAAIITAALNGTNSGQVIIEYYSVPEPSTAALMLIAGGAFMMIRRRKASTH